jgi:hypothetical protein
VNLLCCSSFITYDQTDSLLTIDPFDETFLGFYTIPLLLTDSFNPLLKRSYSLKVRVIMPAPANDTQNVTFGDSLDPDSALA